ncbi:Fur family transcriptional regulator [Flexithrix dorotheae]|uniref:Fur family transcriptional regulator n=1 Tax=Flexithrix dorotheae TaxID=70993 RepID=UPI00036F2153|nr:transcriptional repressor [Flexithrix dorotheae]
MNSRELLSHHKLRITNSRCTILDIFMDAEAALSEYNIEKQLEGQCDRVTIYRTLKTFLDNGIVHKVLDEGNIVKYAVCGTDCEPALHNHEHVHFKCQTCGDTICLDNIPIQKIKLPNGYTKEEANLLILGTCVKCNN